MIIGPGNPGSGVYFAVTQSFKRADKLMLGAVRAIEQGDIIDAAMLVQQAKITAKSGGAMAKAANEISETLLDILA